MRFAWTGRMTDRRCPEVFRRPSSSSRGPRGELALDCTISSLLLTHRLFSGFPLNEVFGKRIQITILVLSRRHQTSSSECPAQRPEYYTNTMQNNDAAQAKTSNVVRASTCAEPRALSLNVAKQNLSTLYKNALTFHGEPRKRRKRKSKTQQEAKWEPKGCPKATNTELN